MYSYNINNRREILTEQNNDKSVNLDRLSTTDIVNLFSEEDLEPQKAVARVKLQLVKSIDLITERISHGGRLFYIGAGTSGRLGVLDASEIPPTFCTAPDMVQAIIAGGDKSLRNSSEQLEDLPMLALEDLNKRGFSKHDSLIGITAGGTTNYVHSGLKFANKLGALTICISCVPSSDVDIQCDVDIRLLTGPELLTGSTRLKAGTATKMALNIISTSIMIKLGKVYGNYMVDVAVTNKKLIDRGLRILEDVGKISREEGIKLLKVTNGSVKLALLIGVSGISLDKAESLLSQYNGQLRASLESLKNG